MRYSRPRPAWQFIAGALVLAVAVNGLLFVWDLRGGHASQRSRADFPLLPAAWVIGAVWTVLLSAMACVQSRVLQRTQEPALQ